MRPTQHPSNNDVLRPPQGATIEECLPLAITRVQYSNGVPGVWSYWQLSEAERALIAAGALVIVCAVGHTHPPIALQVDGVEGGAMKDARRGDRVGHEWDEDAVCLHCGFDGAEDSWLNNNLRLEIGNDEFKYRQTQGEFDAGRYCRVRTDKLRLSEASRQPTPKITPEANPS